MSGSRTFALKTLVVPTPDATVTRFLKLRAKSPAQTSRMNAKATLVTTSAPWTRCWRRPPVARVDPSLAHLFGFQHLMLATLRLFGTPEQWRPLYRSSVQEAWFWGNALNPLDARTTLIQDGDAYLIDGWKSF